VFTLFSGRAGWLLNEATVAVTMTMLTLYRTQLAADLIALLLLYSFVSGLWILALRFCNRIGDLNDPNFRNVDFDHLMMFC
jgi:hypothetical protein